tara:strand:+ start:407 stop:1312 length:906 start_codon:yes stop_codon:yes gene_type:complete
MSKASWISVVGSLNVDLTFRVPSFPAPGETLVSAEVVTSFGGKGGNQAVAAKRAGVEVRMIGCLGDDEQAGQYREHLGEEGIDCSGVMRTEGRTGVASIALNDEGENTIIVHPGANLQLTPAKVEELENLFKGSAVTLLQLECPVESVVKAAQLARNAGSLVVLNPSPWNPKVFESGIPCDILILNEGEAEAMSSGGLAHFLQRGDRTGIVTRGALPTWVFTGGKMQEIAPPEISPVDTVGAGDTFAGVFAASLAEGREVLDSVRMANSAAALATLQQGAQEAIPHRDAIAEMVMQHDAPS